MFFRGGENQLSSFKEFVFVFFSSWGILYFADSLKDLLWEKEIALLFNCSKDISFYICMSNVGGVVKSWLLYRSTHVKRTFHPSETNVLPK